MAIKHKQYQTDNDINKMNMQDFKQE